MIYFIYILKNKFKKPTINKDFFLLSIALLLLLDNLNIKSLFNVSLILS